MEKSLSELDKLFDSILEEIEHPEKAGSFKNPFAEKTDGIGLTGAVSVIFVRVSRDRMRASVRIVSHTPKHKPFNAADIIKAAEEKGVVYGLDRAAIDKVVGEQLINKEVVIAKGRLPVKGTDGRIEHLFDFDGFEEINVNTGDEICRIIPPEKGMSGMDVLGGEIPTEDGKPVSIENGEYTVFSEDGRSLIASEPGRLIYKSGVYSIINELVIKESVTASTGILSFTGSIVIKGDVGSKAIIKAGKSVTIKGSVDGAVIESGGDVTIEKNTYETVITAEYGSIIGNDFNASVLTAGKSITASSIVNCKTKAVERIDCTLGQGNICGGIVYCLGEVFCETMGSRMREMTQVILGDSSEFISERQDILRSLALIDEEIEKLDEKIAGLNGDNSNELSLTDRNLLKAAVKVKAEREEDRIPLSERLNEVEDIIRISAKASLETKTMLYAGVLLAIGVRKLNVAADKPRAYVFANNKGIVIT